MAVRINEVEMMAVNIIANLRGIGARVKGVRDYKVSSKNNSEIDFEGLLGEYAFCKHYNLYFDLSPQPRQGSYDCIYNGKRIDIKSTKHKHGKLLGNVRRNSDVDIYVLAIIDFGHSWVDVTFPGYATSEELYEEKNLTILGDYEQKVYAMDQSQLKKLS